MTTTLPSHARSGIASENLQEILDAESSAGAAMFTGQAQYVTPLWLAQQCQAKLPSREPVTVVDLQCGEGSLIRTGSWATHRFGVDIDNRLDRSRVTGAVLITANCVKAMESLDDITPNLHFQCANSNPPFAKRWKLADGNLMDSTEWTWRQVTKRANYGYFIASHGTLVKLGIGVECPAGGSVDGGGHPWVFRYEVHHGNDVWEGMRDTMKIGIAFWKNPRPKVVTGYYEVTKAWADVQRIVDQERIDRPDFSIYLDKAGYLKTYLSVRSEVKLKLTKEQILKLHRINGAHPLTLTTEKESRDILTYLVNCGIYTVEPAAKLAVERALEEVKALACPIMPVTDFETVAYADEEDTLICTQNINASGMRFTAGKKYPITTGSYRFTDAFTRKKLHFDEETSTQYTVTHDCTRSGQDRFISVRDDNGYHQRFMDRPVNPAGKGGRDREEADLWRIFQKPVVPTIADTQPKSVELNLAVLRSCEMLAGYEYYFGQRPYLARVASKDHALIAAATGTGKTLMAISLLAMKGPGRALIVAPQGTMRSSSDEEDEEDTEFMNASQWIKEINRFAPYLQIWELFSYSDYQRICSMNGGCLPPGVYVSYYQAMFQNGARENTPPSWNDEKLNQFVKTNYGLPPLPLPEEEGSSKRHWCDRIGQERRGIRSIIAPCLATLIGSDFDMVLLDEAHVCTNLDAMVTQMMVRLQPKYRYALTATPLPNIVSNLFSLMGWLAVPGWHMGGIRNAAWPYSREELSRFNNTFLSMERDHTQERMNKEADPHWRGTCQKPSPVISSPARLLKLLKPTMAYISKEACNPEYRAPKIMDVRVPLGKEQAKLYEYYLDRGNIPAKHPLIRARKQTAWLRSICADPAHFAHGGISTPKVRSNMNPKVIAVLELTRDLLTQTNPLTNKGEQVLIINSRIGLTNTIQDKLIEAGVSIARIDSTVSPEQHAYQANLFKRGKAQVMLMGLKCAASHSFEQCKYTIIGSIEYSPGPLNQAAGRTDRVNSRPGVTIYCILHKDTIEEVMFDTVATKDDAATICLKGKRVPRDFKPVDPGEILATAVERFDISGATPEWQCDAKWPELRDAIRLSLGNSLVDKL